MSPFRLGRAPTSRRLSPFFHPVFGLGHLLFEDEGCAVRNWHNKLELSRAAEASPTTWEEGIVTDQE